MNRGNSRAKPLTRRAQYNIGRWLLINCEISEENRRRNKIFSVFFIEVAWNRGRIEALDEAFGKNVCSLDDKPTNGEFIALVADRLRIEKSA